MNLSSRIDAFENLGFAIETSMTNLENGKYHSNDSHRVDIKHYIEQATLENGWFIPEFINTALSQIVEMLRRKALINWLSEYDLEILDRETPKTVSIIMAGNLPLVGFHDMLAVLISGNRVQVKLSQKDAQLPQMMIELLIAIEPRFKDLIQCVEEKVAGYDAVIATGSDNTRRYFEYYFKEVPSIIRGHKNSVAILMGNESKSQLMALTHDLFRYFGLGCRSVSKIYLPVGYAPEKLFPYFEDYHSILYQHHKYMNNYLYQKSIMMVNKTPFLDNGFVMMTENEQIASPISVVHYQYYSSMDDVIQILKHKENSIQCVVTGNDFVPSGIKFGQAQKPSLLDYADGIDVMEFLLSLKLG